jgi:hypothetical protein
VAVVEIVEPTGATIEYLGSHLRDIDRLEAVLFTGCLPEEAVKLSVEHSFVSRVALVDDEPVCIFGISHGQQFDIPWMVGTDTMTAQPPIRIMVQARKFLSNYSALHLSNCILSDNIPSIRFLTGLGFTFHPEFDYEGYKVRIFERMPTCA